MERKIYRILSVILAIIGIVLIVYAFITDKDKEESIKYTVDITNLTYESKSDKAGLKTYTQDDFDTFLKDYKNNKLPGVYITEFLFDGVGMYKAYDLDDFIEDSNDTEVKPVKITVLNINTYGDITIGGEQKGAMIAVNTNNIEKDINIILNGVKIDTDSKKVPAVYVYNKDITYTKSKVTISANENTNNYLEGGKLKKVSLIPSDELTSYTDKYSSENKTNYETYTNYYGVYTKDNINDILFAKVTADSEDLNDGDPYYYYKASGAISSDIDLYFEGKGYLEVTSKNKEGIETKGNLTFSGGTGDYVVTSEDDCLNTTTDEKEIDNARNTLTIDVNSLYAIVSNDADEGDAIDSNGKLIINGGTIVALAKPGQDAGIDSTRGTYINGGTILATGDMYDEVKSDSKQRFIVLSFSGKVAEDEMITLLDEKDEAVFSYKTDREYTTLVYSSKDLEDKTYSLYKAGSINGTSAYGFYTSVDLYTKGDQLGYSSKGNIGRMMGNGPIGNNNMNPPEKPDGDNNREEPPEKPDGKPGDMPTQEMNNNQTAENKDFTLSGISNLFSGVALYQDK